MRREDFEQLVLAALEALPDRFKEHLGNVDVQVMDWPDDDLLDALGIPDDETLFGYYEGISLTATPGPFELPARILIFQRPIEEECDTPEEIVEEVRKTVLHEIGHHFGLSEDEVEHL